MPSLEEHMDAAYELPPEWQSWLATDPDDDQHTMLTSDGRELHTKFGPPPEPETPWRIENDHVATWALRKLAAAEAEQARVKELAMAEIQRIEEWEAKELRRPTRDADFFRGHLAAYWRREMAAVLEPLIEKGMTPEEAWEQVRKKSRSLPTGKLVARRTPAGVEVVDEEQFVRWAQENGYEGLLRAKPALDAIKKLPVVDGEVVIHGPTLPDTEPDAWTVPGVKVKPTEFRYEAKPDTPPLV